MKNDDDVVEEEEDAAALVEEMVILLSVGIVVAVAEAVGVAGVVLSCTMQRDGETATRILSFNTDDDDGLSSVLAFMGVEEVTIFFPLPHSETLGKTLSSRWIGVVVVSDAIVVVAVDAILKAYVWGFENQL